MTKQRLALPESSVWEYAHGLAYQLIREQLAKIDDIKEQCRKSGTHYVASRKVVNIDFLNQSYEISLPDGEVSLKTGKAEVPTREKLLILHYFTQARGTPLSGRLITYKELPEGVAYFRTFSQRALKPIADYFGNEPERLTEMAAILGGQKADYGDTAVVINAFSRVPLTIVLWRGDEEFPAESSIMFDSTITDYLPTEDITVISEVTAWKLVKLLKSRR